MFVFILWREFKLSIAELYNLFPKVRFLHVNPEFLILDDISKDDIIDNFKKIWWVIKVIEINDELKIEKDFLKFGIEYILKSKSLSDLEWESGKFKFAIAKYWEMRFDSFTSGIQIKKELVKSKMWSIRFVNKENKNINSAVFKNEKLGWENWQELNIIKVWDRILAWNTIIFQDVDEYSKRDLWKSRDMQVWMLPPKLAQMMINISWKNSWIYDPFCGLGTVLVEAANSGFKNILWSDIREDLVEISERNLENFIRFKNSKFDYIFFKMDAVNISKINKKLDWFNIVTEWYLWDIMTKWHVTIEKIESQRQKLASLYEWFFSWLRKIDFKWSIVISFPFWEFKGKFYYFSEIYEILKKYWFNPQKLLPDDIGFSETRSWSILYKREDQQVGREIFKLRR